MKLFAFATIYLLLLNLNLQAVPMSTIKGGNCYTLDIPDYMTRTYDLDEHASLQYQNITKEAYTIVVTDSKEQLASLGMKFTDAGDYLENFLKNYMTEAENRQLSQVQTFTANGNNHAQTEFTWSANNISFYMLITVVETKGYYYNILSWTLDSNKGMLKNDFNAIAKSLKD